MTLRSFKGPQGLFLVSLALALFGLNAYAKGPSAQGATPGATEEGPALRVGMDLTFPPFEQADSKGQPTGFSVGLAQKIAEHLHRRLEIKNIAFDGLIPSLKTGKIDLILSSMSITPERQKIVTFSKPYYSIGLAYAYRKGADLKSPEALNAKGVKVALRQATLPDFWAKEHLKNATIKRFDTPQTALSDLLSKRSDALVYDQISIFQYSQKYAGDLDVNLAPLQGSDLPWAAAMRLEDTQLKTQVDDAIADLENNGGIEALQKQYFPELYQALKSSLPKGSR